MIPLRFRFRKNVWRAGVRVTVAVCLICVLAEARAQNDVIDYQISRLRSTEPRARRSAVRELGESKDPRAINALLASLNDQSSLVKEQAAMCLGQNKEIRAVEPLTELLKDADPSVRYSAVVALAQIKDPRAVVPLTDALTDPDQSVRRAAGDALDKISNNGAVESALGEPPLAFQHNPSVERFDELIEMLKGNDSALRATAAFQLGQSKDPRAVEPLITASKDSDPYVKSAAINALEAINDPRSIEIVRAYKERQAEGMKAAFTATLKGGTVCYITARNGGGVGCIRNNALAKVLEDVTPRLHMIDGQGPGEYLGKKRAQNVLSFNEFNIGGGFKVPITAGHHTLAVEFHYQLGTSRSIIESDWADVDFIAAAGHSYEVDAFSRAGKWAPIVIDVTDKRNWEIAPGQQNTDGAGLKR